MNNTFVDRRRDWKCQAFIHELANDTKKKRRSPSPSFRTLALAWNRLKSIRCLLDICWCQFGYLITVIYPKPTYTRLLLLLEFWKTPIVVYSKSWLFRVLMHSSPSHRKWRRIYIVVAQCRRLRTMFLTTFDSTVPWRISTNAWAITVPGQFQIESWSQMPPILLHITIGLSAPVCNGKVEGSLHSLNLTSPHFIWVWFQTKDLYVREPSVFSIIRLYLHNHPFHPTRAYYFSIRLSSKIVYS